MKKIRGKMGVSTYFYQQKTNDDSLNFLLKV